jgi:hypothetical protein
MNKVREILEKIKRHQFWILCGIVALVGIVSWWMATGSLAETYNKNKAEIDSYQQKVKSVADAPQHHNDSSITKYKEQTEQTKKQVYDAWQKIYDEQKAKVYVWPTDVLGKEFVDHVTSLGPNEDIDLAFRTYYQTRAVNHFKKLAALMEAEWVDPRASTGRTEYNRGSPRANVGAMYKVEWAAQKFQELQGNYMWPETPTTKQIKYAEEEFWILTALCEAIREANKDSTGSHNAAVRRIDEMLVAYLAAEENPLGFGEKNRIAKPEMEMKVGEDGAADPAAVAGAPLTRPDRPDLKATSRDSPSYERMSRAAPAAAPSIDSDGAAAGPVSVDDALMNWRYVDNKCKPLMGSEIASQGAEYRLSPWRLTALVDQRQLDKFLIAFRNTTMPLEIKQVRVNPQEVTPMIGPAAAAQGGYDRRDSGSSAVDMGGTVTVELRGVAYLFNAPDQGKIGAGGEADSGSTDPAGLDGGAVQ